MDGARGWVWEDGEEVSGSLLEPTFLGLERWVAQQLRELIGLVEDLGALPSTHTELPGRLTPSFWPLWAPVFTHMMYISSYRHTHLFTNKNKNSC